MPAHPKKLLITGICGFAGQTLANTLREHMAGLEIVGLDNLARPGSELNRRRSREVKFIHGDLRNASDVDALPPCDWVLDAAANPSVLAGLDHPGASRQLLEHNLLGTVNLLEYCRRHRAGFILLSTSRVYSSSALAKLEMQSANNAFRPTQKQTWPGGCSEAGIAESFSTQPPLSLYGSTKLASEILAMEYGAAFNFPVWLNRCGVLAGAGQFGKADQGIFSYWIHAYAARRPLRYIGFEGRGLQVRDALHPADLVQVLVRQMQQPEAKPELSLNFGGGVENSMSLAQLSDWCAKRFGPHKIAREATPRPYDVPWLVMDCRAAARRWDWKPQQKLFSLLEQLAAHAEKHPDWLDLTSA